MNESTYSNACDPNSMKDQGHTRNAVYNVVMEGQPPIVASAYSKALVPPEKLNKSFYSFGGNHSNIRKQLNTPNRTEGRKKLVSLLDSKFKDIRAMTNGEESEYIDKAPNTVMNDYTKNIS